MIRYGVLSFFVAAMAFASGSQAKTVVTDQKTYARAGEEACVGKNVGVSCQIEFTGGTVGFGVCVLVPGPAGGYLTCQLDVNKLPSNCKNNALNTPSSWMAFGGLAGFLLLLRRKKKNSI
jgi:hypothetical protein